MPRQVASGVLVLVALVAHAAAFRVAQPKPAAGRARAARAPRGAFAPARAHVTAVASRAGRPSVDLYEDAEWHSQPLHALTEERDACGVGFLASEKGESSRRIVEYALTALSCMEHRGGCSADGDSGDGAGLMTAIPWNVVLAGAQLDASAGEPRGLGMIFLPQDEKEAATSRELIEATVRDQGLGVAGWREVPVANEVLAPMAAANVPRIEQIIIGAPTELGVSALDDKLYEVRRRAEARVRTAAKEQAFLGEPYIASCSARTVVYKGMVRSAVLDRFYLDLQNPAYESSFAVYHRRFSTNTLPRWSLAQPMRVLGHNGEINTLLGNLNWMRARERALKEGNEDEALRSPLVDRARSDSANLDGAAELLARQPARDLPEALMVLVPEAYESNAELDEPRWEGVSDFYKYHALFQESWDGPALLVFSDGKWIGSTLDRNGLRPARFLRTNDGLVCMMSETGAVPVPESSIIEKGRLGPGQMIALKLSTGEFFHNYEVKPMVAKRADYASMLHKTTSVVAQRPFVGESAMSEEELLLAWTAFGWSLEDVGMGIADMASTAKETTFCMGDDAPLACMSDKPHMLYDYLKQRFAQVTNPPIDPIREGLVMSLKMTLGSKRNVLADEDAHAPSAAGLSQLTLDSPVINFAELDEMAATGLKIARISTVYAVADEGGLQGALERVCAEAVDAVNAGAQLVILTDKPDALGARSPGPAATKSDLFIPPLLATGTVHHHLLAKALRTRASLVVQTAQAWSTHHVACLVGYGASAVHPYLAYESVINWWHSPKTVQARSSGALRGADSVDAALANYRAALEAGLLKILSKIGISLLSSYHGAQIFEAIGVSDEVIQLALRGTPSRLGGLSLAEIEEECRMFHRKAFGEDSAPTKLENYGFVKYYNGREHHHNSPPLTKMLHSALEAASKGDAYDKYALFAESVKNKPPTSLRDLLEVKSDRSPIPLEEVEPVEEIMKTFCSGAMSLGALSREAHETIAVAMNRIGGKSNSGEGGEDSLRFQPITDVDESTGVSASFPHLSGLRNGDLASSAIKQVASGRFGVTAGYLANAQQLEIKMAQGAKPGEGGQLPGTKVDSYIARLRNSKEGITLISPPPHHDIYSIEDLAQLIYDLHEINQGAQVSVKLVSEVGIGTVAAGVAKANADVIQISGHDGGTGASPLSSIKHAGSPWELGLAEVHSMLIENGLRDRVTLRVDGGLKTGYDVVQAALLGADEYGFGTIVMIAEGCIMARICHTNKCPVGVTTQNVDLRKRFSGTPGGVEAFFKLVGEEVRHTLAQLGYKTLRELVGRADLLKHREGSNLAKTRGLDLSYLMSLPPAPEPAPIRSTPHGNGAVLDDDFLGNAAVKAVVESGSGAASLEVEVKNTDRSVGTRLSGHIAKRHGDKGFKGTLDLTLRGAAGQSLGAFLLPGVNLRIDGESNDYVGKGMHGGKITVCPPEGAPYDPTESAIIGNTCLYGATGGQLFACGRAGERFAVRNSGTDAVIEGAGDHCCEYMTAGTVVVLGSAGNNIGAGMTGGLGYFYDPEDAIPGKLNTDIVSAQRLPTPEAEAQLRALIQAHVEETGSARGKLILDNWESEVAKFWQVVPPAEADRPETRATSGAGVEAAAPVAR